MHSQQHSQAPHELSSFRNEYNKTTVEKNDTLIYAMGGLGEIGKNTYCFEHGNEILIVDAGVRFPEDNLLGVDYVIPDYTHLIKHNRKRKIFVITHGHEDHIGGIPFLLRSVQIEAIYAPRFASALIRKKLEEHRMVKNVKLIEINDQSSIHMKHFTVGFFNTIHSIPDSLGILINTPNGRVVETGDFKFDLTPLGLNADYQVMAYMGQIGVDLLMSDSTNSGVEDFSISEKKVAQEIMDIMRKTTGRLIVATFASNVLRVAQILEAAVKCGRKVCIFGRSMENVVTIGRKMETSRSEKNTSWLLKNSTIPRLIRSASYVPVPRRTISCPFPHRKRYPSLDQIDPRRYGRFLFFTNSGKRRKRQPGREQTVPCRCQCIDKIRLEQSAYDRTCFPRGTKTNAAIDQAEILYAGAWRIQDACSA